MDLFLRPFIVFYLSGVVVAAGLHFGETFLRLVSSTGHKFGYSGNSYTNWDAQWYKKIAESGYDFSPTDYSSAAFFPVYPMVGRLVARLTGLSVDMALLIVANLAFLASLVLILRYAQRRYGAEGTMIGEYTILALAISPTAVFFRVNYTESILLLILVTFLYGMEHGWRPAVLAVLVGVATSTRPVGVALVPVLMLDMWQRGGSRTGRIAHLACLLPVSVAGLMAFMAYLWYRFGDPLAFVHAQHAWNAWPGTSLTERLVSLVTLEPLWLFLVPSSGAYWGLLAPGGSLLFDLQPYNVAAFLAAWLLVALGWYRRWLNGRETLLAALLLLIPYVTNGYATNMNSMARYTSVVFPAYLVLGRVLARLEGPVVTAAFAVSGFFLGAFSALFAAWHNII